MDAIVKSGLASGLRRGAGRVVARLDSARLCRCGGSQSKPFCDGTHARIGFRSGPQ
jgi:CDGSH-type Zn-finger protein